MSVSRDVVAMAGMIEMAMAMHAIRDDQPIVIRSPVTGDSSNLMVLDDYDLFPAGKGATPNRYTPHQGAKQRAKALARSSRG